MTKYKLLKPLPWIEVWTILEEIKSVYHYDGQYVSDVFARKYPDFFEEVKEKKTIYDLEIGDFHWFLDTDWEVIQVRLYNKEDLEQLSGFLTEREAKRNKLLRELATRTDKWLPEKWEKCIWWDWETCTWDWMEWEIAAYHFWFVFRDKEEYEKYINEEARDLLFNL